MVQYFVILLFGCKECVFVIDRKAHKMLVCFCAWPAWALSFSSFSYVNIHTYRKSGIGSHLFPSYGRQLAKERKKDDYKKWSLGSPLMYVEKETNNILRLE